MASLSNLQTFSLVFLLSVTFSSVVSGHERQLHPKYRLEWNIIENGQIIEFKSTVETLGWVGLGISPAGLMNGADLAIGGWTTTNQSDYFGDYHGMGNEMPMWDTLQNWVKQSISETATHTVVTMRRPLDTGDANDQRIVDQEQFLIWAYGENDSWNLNVNHVERGALKINLMNPDGGSSASIKITHFGIVHLVGIVMACLVYGFIY